MDSFFKQVEQYAADCEAAAARIERDAVEMNTRIARFRRFGTESATQDRPAGSRHRRAEDAPPPDPWARFTIGGRR